MTKNKLLLSMLALLLCLSLAAFAAAEVTEGTDEPTPDPTPHVHVWGPWTDVVEATCEHPGVQERYCDCGDADARELPQLPHSWSAWYDVIPATCTTQGLEERECVNCGIVDEARYTDMLPHSYGDWYEVVPATCTSKGVRARACSVCEDEEAQETDMIPHSWDNGVRETEPTYSEMGWTKYTCTVCGATESRQDVPKKRRPSTQTTEEQPAAEDIPALPYGSIVTDVTREIEEYEAEIVEEKVEGSEEVNHVLVITAEPDETGAYVLRNLHINDELLAKLAEDHIEIVRFVVGTATVEFPVASFTGEVMTTIKADLASPAKEFIVTVDPTATTAEGNPGCSVSASIACEDGSEFDITGVVEGLTVTMNGVAQAVTEAAVYAA